MITAFRTNSDKAMRDLTNAVLDSTMVAINTSSLLPLQHAQTILTNAEETIEYHGEHDPRPALQRALDQATDYITYEGTH